MRQIGSFGAILSAYRATAGLSQEELAERAGISRRGIADLERGARRRPHPITARRLADALALSAADQIILLHAARPVSGAASNDPAAYPPPANSLPLPLPLTSFVGRDRELKEVTRLLETTRLLTLTGAGGVGKTRLALRVAAAVAANYTDGIRFVELASLADEALVPKTVASALDLAEQPGRTLVETLAHALHVRHLLLVLDNCEHVAHATAALIESLMRECPRLQVLTTSRHVLRVSAETVWWVPSLQLPDQDASITLEHVTGSEAVQLFLERARAVQPQFSIDRHNASSVARICRQLDGIPLALELAATRLMVLTPEQIADRLDDRFTLLTHGSLTALPRQQTLRGALDWSFELLTEPERALLRRLSVFAGGWTLEAAESITGGAELAGNSVLDLLEALAGKSLVVVSHQPTAARYSLLETVRQYASERLHEVEEEREDTARRHCDWYKNLAEQAEPHLYSREQVHWLERLECEHDNLRVALAWTRSRVDEATTLARLARPLWWFWYLHGHFDEGGRWLERAATENHASPTRAGVLLGAGWLAYGRGELAHAIDLLQQSLTLAREVGADSSAAQSLIALAFSWRDLGRPDLSGPLLEECAALSHETGNRWCEGMALYLMGGLASFRRDDAATARLCGRSVAIFRDLGERLGLAYTLYELARVAFNQADDHQAIQLCQTGLDLSRELGNRRGICFALEGLALGARRQGDLARAWGMLRDALVLWQQLGNYRNQAFALAGLAVLAADRHEVQRAARLFGAAEVRLPSLAEHPRAPEAYADAFDRTRKELGHASFANACTVGRARNIDGLLEEIRSWSPRDNESGAIAPDAIPLSARECEIAALVADGYSNRQIAEALVIAPRTADTHVGHILSKLGLHSRAQIAAWVVEHGLVEAGRMTASATRDNT